jgi:hypothetical protein
MKSLNIYRSESCFAHILSNTVFHSLGFTHLGILWSWQTKHHYVIRAHQVQSISASAHRTYEVAVTCLMTPPVECLQLTCHESGGANSVIKIFRRHTTSYQQHTSSVVTGVVSKSQRIVFCSLSKRRALKRKSRPIIVGVKSHKRKSSGRN